MSSPKLFLDWVKGLPFDLTAAQSKALKEIENDLVSGRAMNRLLQGDVGSGKTIIAFAALYLAVLNGHQGNHACANNLACGNSTFRHLDKCLVMRFQ